MNDDKGKLGYRIGPPADLAQEIGQIIVSYSECERAIFSIFQLVMRLSAEDAHLLVKHANVNAEKMVAIITSKIDQIRPKLLVTPLKQFLDEFKRLTQSRNILAHWQWAVTDGESGLAFNSIKGKPDQAYKGQTFELSDLKSIAWSLAKTAVMLNTVAVGIRPPGGPLTQSRHDWRQCYYRSRVEDVMIQYALDRTVAQLDAVEASILSSSQPASSDKAL